MPHRLHPHAGERFAELVGDAARDDAPARQGEIDLLDRLGLSNIEWATRLERPNPLRVTKML